ncbi:MAG: hypothetical protein HY554_09200 [Elusimicrobia bacterium]|nr:hypothetical protein [Elusimicrobiota bacterium]
MVAWLLSGVAQGFEGQANQALAQLTAGAAVQAPAAGEAVPPPPGLAPEEPKSKLTARELEHFRRIRTHLRSIGSTELSRGLVTAHALSLRGAAGTEGFILKRMNHLKTPQIEFWIGLADGVIAPTAAGYDCEGGECWSFQEPITGARIQEILRGELAVWMDLRVPDPKQKTALSPRELERFSGLAERLRGWRPAPRGRYSDGPQPDYAEICHGMFEKHCVRLTGLGGPETARRIEILRMYRKDSGDSGKPYNAFTVNPDGTIEPTVRVQTCHFQSAGSYYSGKFRHVCLHDQVSLLDQTLQDVLEDEIEHWMKSEPAR